VGSALYGRRERVVGNPGIGGIHADRRHADAEEQAERPETRMGGQFECHYQDNGRVAK
jgi:hypothetical protein